MPEQHSHDWSEVRGEWWSGPGRGEQTWRGFGRRMFFAALFFLAFVTLVIAGIVTVVAYAWSGLQNASLGVVVLCGTWLENLMW